MRKIKKKRKIVEKDGKLYTPRGIELTRCSNTMTDSEFFSWILSNARRLTLRWKPRNDVLNEGRRPYTGTDKRTKWEYRCEKCKKWYKKSSIEVDHIDPCGGIKSFESIENWYRKALVEKEGFRKLCVNCHQKVTHKKEKR